MSTQTIHSSRLRGVHLGKEGSQISGGKEKKDMAEPVLLALLSPSLNCAMETSAIARERSAEPFLDQDGIPEELQGRQFPDIDSLHDELDVLGLSDCKFLLNDDGFVIIPDPEHNRAT